MERHVRQTGRAPPSYLRRPPPAPPPPPGSDHHLPAATTTYGYDADDELVSRNGSTTGWAYDSDGQPTSSPTLGAQTYNARLYQTSVTPTGAASATTFGYDGLGNADRNTLTSPAGTSTSTTGLLGLATINTATGPSNLTAYHYAPDGNTFSAQNGAASTSASSLLPHRHPRLRGRHYQRHRYHYCQVRL